jgi:hypothetical protein
MELKNTITKEQFLNGEPFFNFDDSPGAKILYLKPKGEPPYIYDHLYLYNSKEYFCLVYGINKNGFTFSTTLFGKQLKGTIKFNRCILLTPQT